MKKFQENMKYFSISCLLFTLLISCNNSKTNQSTYENQNEVSIYNTIQDFSNRIKKNTGLTLCSYASNHHLPKNYIFKNEIATISVDYKVFKNRNDVISIDEARNLIINLEESFLKEINSNQKTFSKLETYPFNQNLVDVGIYFIDENQIDLGQGVSEVRFFEGKITYKSYEISEYTEKYPVLGRHFKIHEESYEEALEIVKQNNELIYF